jgi:uncharacterized membrane protein YbhN (UPF0104 family)
LLERFQSLRARLKQPAFKRISYALRLVFSLGLLYVIFRQIDLPAALNQASALPVGIALAIMALSILRHFIQFNNWRCALHLNPAYEYRAREVAASYLVALPLRFVLPGGHASFAKVFYLKNSSILASIVSTTSERLFMTWSTWTFAAVAAFFSFPQLSLALRLAMLVFSAFMPLWAALIMASKATWREFLPAYSVQAPRMMLLQIANTLIMYVQYYLILNILGSISAIETWLGMALTNISNSIPITISGLGLREGFAIHFLDGYGFSSEQAVAVTLSLFFFQDVIPAIVGAVVLIRVRRKA